MSIPSWSQPRTITRAERRERIAVRLAAAMLATESDAFGYKPAQVAVRATQFAEALMDELDHRAVEDDTL